MEGLTTSDKAWRCGQFSRSQFNFNIISLKIGGAAAARYATKIYARGAAAKQCLATDASLMLTGDARLEFLRNSGPAPEMREH